MMRQDEQFRSEVDRDRWETLRRMTAAESIAVGEALLTSDIMRVAEFPDDDQPMSLAIALGIRSDATRISRAHPDGAK